MELKIAIVAAIFSFLGSIGGGYLVWFLSAENERYLKLYGPLKFNLEMMKLITQNRDDVITDIKKWENPQNQIDLIKKHINPLVKKWIEHKDNVRNLFEKYPGLIRKKDFKKVSDFMDGCIKREITEDLQNFLALEEERVDKLLRIVTLLQEKI